MTEIKNVQASIENGRLVITLAGVPDGIYSVVRARTHSDAVLTDGEGLVTWSSMEDEGVALSVILVRSDRKVFTSGDFVTVEIDGKNIKARIIEESN